MMVQRRAARPMGARTPGAGLGLPPGHGMAAFQALRQRLQADAAGPAMRKRRELRAVADRTAAIDRAASLPSSVHNERYGCRSFWTTTAALVSHFGGNNKRDDTARLLLDQPCRVADGGSYHASRFGLD